jgi:hypothetical protein
VQEYQAYSLPLSQPASPFNRGSVEAASSPTFTPFTSPFGSPSLYSLPSPASAYIQPLPPSNKVSSALFKPSFPVLGTGPAQFSFYEAVAAAPTPPGRRTPYYGAAKAAHSNKFVSLPTGEVKNPLREAVEKRAQPPRPRYENRPWSVACFHAMLSVRTVWARLLKERLTADSHLKVVSLCTLPRLQCFTFPCQISLS